MEKGKKIEKKKENWWKQLLEKFNLISPRTHLEYVKHYIKGRKNNYFIE